MGRASLLLATPTVVCHFKRQFLKVVHRAAGLCIFKRKPDGIYWDQRSAGPEKSRRLTSHISGRGRQTRLCVGLLAAGRRHSVPCKWLAPGLTFPQGPCQCYM